MKFMSEYLAENEIESLKSKERITDQEKIRLHWLEKEIEVFRFLKVNGIDMQGTIDDLKEKLEKSEVFVMQKGEFDKLNEKAKLYDEIKNIVSNSSK